MSPLSPLISDGVLDVPVVMSATSGRTVAKPFDRNYMMDNNEAPYILHPAPCILLIYQPVSFTVVPSMLTIRSRQPLIP